MLGGYLFTCPYPECGHVGSLITNLHCRQVHEMTKIEVFEQYGEPEQVKYDAKSLSKNSKIKTIVINNERT